MRSIVSCAVAALALVACSNDQHESSTASAGVPVGDISLTAPTDAELSADKQHCEAIAKAVASGLKAITDAVDSSDAAGLAQIADISENLDTGLSQDSAPASLRALPQRVLFMSDAREAIGFESVLAKDAANYLGGDTSIKLTDLRHSTSSMKEAAAATQQDLDAYEGEASSSPR